MDDKLTLLYEREAIKQVIYTYATAVDLCNWPLFRSIFTDHVEIDFSSYHGEPASTMTADEWVKCSQVIVPGLDGTQHQFSNLVIDIQGDEATARFHMQSEHFLANEDGDNSHSIGGYYIDKLVRTEDGWRICAVNLNILWKRGNPQVNTLAVQRVAEGKAERPTK